MSDINNKFKEGSFVVATCDNDHHVEGYVVDTFTNKNEIGEEERIVVIGTMGESNFFVEEKNVQSQPLTDFQAMLWSLRSIDQNLKILNEKIDAFVDGATHHHDHEHYDSDEDDTENFRD